VSFARLVSQVKRQEEDSMRFIGLDVHRDFCEVAISEGGKARRAGRVAARPAELELFAQSLASDDQVVLEATGNALAIARILAPHVGEVVLAHARKLRAIAEAKVKTDAVDACTLASSWPPALSRASGSATRGHVSCAGLSLAAGSS
jgi:hypothetical protein